MKVVAGCDGGGTKTVVRVQAIDEQGAVAAEGSGQAGPGNVSLEIDSAIRNIGSAAAQALEQASLKTSQTIDILVAGLAGAGRLDDQQRARSLLHQAVNVHRVEVVPDAAVLFAAANLSSPAIALIVGTGSIAWARNEQGELHRCGGWGPLLGDEGSGYWIGLEAIKRTVCCLNECSQGLKPDAIYFDRNGAGHRYYDGTHSANEAAASAETAQETGVTLDGIGHASVDAARQTDSLTREVLDHFSISSLDELIAAVYGQGDQRATIALLAPKVCAEFEESLIAREIMETAASHLSGLLVSSARAAFDEELPPNVKWICAGGVGVNQQFLRERIRKQCASQGLQLDAPIVVENPVDGAVKLARHFLVQ